VSTAEPVRGSASYTIASAVVRASAWPSAMPQILATSSGTLVVCGVRAGCAARVLLGVGGVVGAVSRPGGVEGAAGNSTIAVRLRLAGDYCGPSETTVTTSVGRRSGLLASVELSAVGGRARLLVLVVSGGGTALPRSGAVAARGALGAPTAAVGMPAAVRAGEGCRDEARVYVGSHSFSWYSMNLAGKVLMCLLG
jgi:hypothetical protein